MWAAILYETPTGICNRQLAATFNGNVQMYIKHGTLQK